MELVNRIPVRDGANSANPARPLRGTLNSRQRYPASSCQNGGGAEGPHAPPNDTTPSPAARARRTPAKPTGAPNSDAPVGVVVRSRRCATGASDRGAAAAAWLASAAPCLPTPVARL